MIRGTDRQKICRNNRADTDLKHRLSAKRTNIWEGIKGFLGKGDIQSAREAVLNLYWLKLGAHELPFGRVQYGRDERTSKIKKRRLDQGADHANRLKSKEQGPQSPGK